jgi:hypothetical protein
LQVLHCFRFCLGVQSTLQSIEGGFELPALCHVQVIHEWIIPCIGGIKCEPGIVAGGQAFVERLRVRAERLARLLDFRENLLLLRERVGLCRLAGADAGVPPAKVHVITIHYFGFA